MEMININVTNVVETINEMAGANRSNLKEAGRAMVHKLRDNMRFLEPEMFLITPDSEVERREDKDMVVRNEESKFIFSLRNYQMTVRMAEDDFHIDLQPGITSENEWIMLRNYVRALLLVDDTDRDAREDLVNLYDELSIKVVQIAYLRSQAV